MLCSKETCGTFPLISWAKANLMSQPDVNEIELYNILPDGGTIYHRLEIRCSYFNLGVQNPELIEGQHTIWTSPKDQCSNLKLINERLTSLLLEFFILFCSQWDFFLTNSFKLHNKVLTWRHNFYWSLVLSFEIRFIIVHLILNQGRKSYI